MFSQTTSRRPRPAHQAVSRDGLACPVSHAMPRAFGNRPVGILRMMAPCVFPVTTFMTSLLSGKSAIIRTGLRAGVCFTAFPARVHNFLSSCSGRCAALMKIGSCCSCFLPMVTFLKHVSHVPATPMGVSVVWKVFVVCVMHVLMQVVAVMCRLSLIHHSRPRGIRSGCCLCSLACCVPAAASALAPSIAALKSWATCAMTSSIVS